jgi:hypothetical protein
MAGQRASLDEWKKVVAARPGLLDAVRPRLSPYAPHSPTPKQAAFLLLNCKEAFYGGSAGGGKSDALLMAALQYVDTPGYSALILRKTYSDLNLPGAIMDRAKSWLAGSPARWSEKDKTFRFPSGATLSFGFLDNANDIYRYQGSEFQFCGFDELTQFPENSYKYLFTRLRKLKGSPVPIRMRSASNPGGIGHSWVKQRFIDNHSNPERVFISASLVDNPHLDQEDYARSLSELDPVTKARMLEGDWHIQRAGLVYPEFANPGVIVPPRPLPRGLHYGGIDFGFHNPFAAVGGVLDEDDVLWVYYERYKRGMTIPDHARFLPREPEIRWFADPAGAEQIAQLRKLDFVMTKANNRKDYGIPQVSHRIRTGRLKVFSTCTALSEEAGLYHYPEGPRSRPPRWPTRRGRS